MITKLILIALFSSAFYLIIADIIKLPTIRTSKAMKNLSKAQKEKTSTIDIWLGNLANFIAKHLRLNEFSREELQSDLMTASVNISPEMYIANAIVKALLVGVFAIPVYFVMPIMSPLVLFLAFVTYKLNTKSVAKKIKEKRYRIESDLPRLVATISTKIGRSRNVPEILADFCKYAGPELKNELEITIADMSSGTEAQAIQRLENRVGSPMMSDVCRGFSALFLGDAAPIYWQTLSVKFNDIGRQRLKKEAEKAPKKVKRLSMCLLFCFMLTYVVVIVSQIMDSMGMLFG